MKMRGRNRKWLRTGNGRTVGNIGLVVLFKFCARIEKCGRRHVRVGSEHCCRSGRRPVNGEKGANGGELTVDFFFLDIEESSDMLDHLLVGKSHLRVSRAVRRRRGDNVRGVAGAVGRGRRARREKAGEDKRDIFGMVGQLCGV